MKTKKIAVTVSLLISAASAEAYTLESAHWAPGTVPFYLNLGGASLNNVAAHELSVWDQYTGNTHLSTTSNSAVNGGVWFMDGRNTIEYSNDVGWDLPGNVLGVCSINYGNDTIMEEADILLNSDWNWSADNELAWVLLHEIGHAIGLGHSQYYTSVMWPYFSGNLAELGADDIAGAKFLYGARSEGSVPDSGNTAILLGLAAGLLIFCNRRKDRPRHGERAWIYEQ